MTLLAAVAIVAGESGCSTSPNSSAGKKPAANDEWVMLPSSTGSNIPRYVRRSELGTAAAATNVETVGGQALNNPDRDLKAGSGGK